MSLDPAGQVFDDWGGSGGLCLAVEGPSNTAKLSELKPPSLQTSTDNFFLMGGGPLVASIESTGRTVQHCRHLHR